MTKEDYIKTISLMAAIQLAGRLRIPEFGSAEGNAVRVAGEIFVEAEKLADREFRDEKTAHSK